MDRYLKRSNQDREVSNDDGLRKKRKNNQKFREEYTKKFPCLVSGKDGFAKCNICSSEFSIVHGGLDDCRRHVIGPKHCATAKAQVHQQPINNFYSSKLEENGVIKAEVLFVRFLIEHNISLSASDHSGALFKKMFPDSDIAKKYGCGHTKTQAITVSTAEGIRESTLSKLRTSLFSLSTDGSNDISDKKLYPLIFNYYDEEKGQIVSSLVSLSESTNNTGEGIFQLLDGEFKKYLLKWESCIAFSSDNANTMAGCNKGVLSYIKQKQPNIKFIGCPCHLVHLAAQKATASLPVDVENLVIKVFYYLEKSSKRN
ncbi:zinc finger BED domain-containing protein 5-like [Parasteatoda tepidariorum]|uniref:zinc finger BED domain-containing protein 5-like n=1 Tax=Parasteatoda tepidariorum TaxID=114398 RepID=UPI0039BD0A2E